MGTDIHSIEVKRDGQWVTVAVSIAGDQRYYNTLQCWPTFATGAVCGLLDQYRHFPVIHEPRSRLRTLGGLEDHTVHVDKPDLVAAWNWDGKEHR